MTRLEAAYELYQAGQIEDALELIRILCANEPSNADAWGLRARISRHAGLVADSDDAFRRAHDLLPSQMPLPHRVTRQRFLELLEQARRILRDDRAGLAEGILLSWGRGAADTHVDVVDLPGRDVIRGGLSPDSKWSWRGQTLVLYQGNHENAAGSDRELLHLIVRSLAVSLGPGQLQSSRHAG